MTEEGLDLSVGDVVEAHGLKAVHLNGLVARVTKLENEAGRIEVLFEGELGLKALRPVNLKPAPEESEAAARIPDAPPAPPTPTQSQSQQQQQPQQPQPEQGSSAAAASPMPLPPLASKEGVRFYTHLATILLSVLCLIPVGRISSYSYLGSMVATQLNLLLSLHSEGKLSRSSLSKEGIAAIFMSPTGQTMMYVLMHMFFRANIMVLLPLFLMSLYYVSLVAKHAAPVEMRTQYKQYFEMIENPMLQTEIMNQAAFVEAILAFTFLLELFLGRGNVIQLFLHLQFLRVKYTVSWHSKAAWNVVAGAVDKVFYHRFCPSLIGGAWGKLKSLIHRYADMKPASASA